MQSKYRVSVCELSYRVLVIENRGGADTLYPTWPANDVAFYCFSDVDRRHETPGSETKDCLTRDIASSMDCMFALVRFAPQGP